MTGTPSLDRVLALSGLSVGSAEADPYLEQQALLLSAQAGLETALVRLASDPDDDGDDDSSEEGDTDNDRDHLSHATFKAMKKRGMPDKAAAKVCAKADKKKADVKATQLAWSSLAALEVALSVTQAERDKAHDAGNSLPDKSFPINNTKQLHAAATLWASGHGKDPKAAEALIRRRAKELGVDVNTLPGFGDDDGDADDKMAATALMLAAGRGKPAHLFGGGHQHEPFDGVHSHAVMHEHFNDGHHGVAHLGHRGM